MDSGVQDKEAATKAAGDCAGPVSLAGPCRSLWLQLLIISAIWKAISSDCSAFRRGSQVVR